jgi:hypothetical protein
VCFILCVVPTRLSPLMCVVWVPAPRINKSGTVAPGLGSQDSNPLTRRALAERVIVTAGQHGADQRLGCLLAALSPGKYPLVHGHQEFLAFMGVAGDDVRLQIREGLPEVSDLFGQVAKLPADAVCSG